MLCNSQSWKEISEHFEASLHLKPMSGMVTTITNSNEASWLSGFVFLESLLVSRNAVFEMFSDCIHIGFDVNANLFSAMRYCNGKRVWEKEFSMEEINMGFAEIVAKAKLDC